jgi:hypothetical protein
MKSVIKPKPRKNNIVVSTETAIYKYYGVCLGGPNRGFISRREFETGCFTVSSPYKLTGGNGWVHFDTQSLSTTIDKLIDNGNEVFEFDTFNDLMKWVGDID